MFAQRALWAGGTLTSVVMGILAYVAVPGGLPQTAFIVVFGLLFLASMLMFPWGRKDDGSVLRLHQVVRGPNSPSLVAGQDTTNEGNFFVSGKATVNNYNGLTVAQMEVLEKRLDTKQAREVEEYVDRRLEVFKDAAKFSGEANVQAASIASHVITEFVEQLASKAPENLPSLRTADMQHAILNAQTSAAVSDNEELADTLVDILVDKSGAEPRSFKGVVLTEALHVAGKLTTDQVNLLTSLLILTQTINHEMRSEPAVLDWLAEQCEPIYDKIPINKSAMHYMQYTGVGTSLPLLDSNMADHIIDLYDGVFNSGFRLGALQEKTDSDDAEVLINKWIAAGIAEIENPENPNYDQYRIRVASSETLKKFHSGHPLMEYLPAVKRLITENRISSTTFMHIARKKNPQFANFVSKLDDLGIADFRLSTVGVALGQANWRRLDPNGAPSFDIYID